MPLGGCAVGAVMLAGLAGLPRVRLGLYMLSREHMANWAMLGKSCREQEGRRGSNRYKQENKKTEAK